MTPDLVNVVARQDEIIELQSDIINNLFRLLLQHISAEEADRLPEVQKINEAARLRSNDRLGL